jgi:hypothetical membrane protein
MTRVLKVLLVITGCALLFAIAPWPYEYYVMLRGLVSISTVLLAFVVIRSQQYGWLFLAIPAFLLWSPLVGVLTWHLELHFWQPGSRLILNTFGPKVIEVGFGRDWDGSYLTDPWGAP